MSGYTKTTIVECARSQSEEAQNNNNSNPAQWTNRVGTGLKLKPGDTISVHSSFVSEIGAQAGEIQIKGEELGKEVEVEVINTEKLLFDKDLPEKYQLENASLIKKKIQLRDDTLNMVVSPYKSANGEYYTFLPRIWAGLPSGTGGSGWVSFDQTPHSGTLLAKLGQCQHARPPLNMCAADVELRRLAGRSTNNPENKVAGFNDGARYTIFKAKQTFFGTPTAEVTLEGQTHAGEPTITFTHGSTTESLLVGMELKTQSPSVVFPEPPLATIIVSIDSLTQITMDGNASENTNSHNSFTFEVSASSTDQYLPPNQQNSSLTESECEALRDPAILGDYIQVKDLLELKVKPGYNSPTDVSVQLTQELNERSDIEYLKYDFTEHGQEEKNMILSFKTESPAYKLYHCATATSWTGDTSGAFFNVSGEANVNQSYQYLSSFQHIGIKRPEFYIAGKELNASTGFVTTPQDFTRQQDQVFNTGLAWGDVNLLKLKKFFDSQAIYPELFDDYNQNDIPVTAERTRFIHMNLFDQGPNDPTAVNYPSNFATLKAEASAPLGYDYYFSSVDASQGSFPLFIDYNPETLNFSANDVGYTDYGGQYGTTIGKPMISDYNDLAFGFARKIRRSSPVPGGNDYFTIGFQFTQTANKIPGHFLQPNRAYSGDEPQIGTAGGRRFGFDHHFSAYGTMAMNLYNGNTDLFGRNGGEQSLEAFNLFQSQNFTSRKLDPYKNGIYLGADEPIINYNQSQQRFQLESFHTAEVENQDYNAGASILSGDPVSPNPDAADKCYKINKVFFRQTYTPEMAPYRPKFNASLTGQGAPTEVARFNENVKPFSIMDAQSGLFIENWVVPEEYWDRSLVGIMGFRYNQFHNPNSTSSRQVRIKAHGANADLHNVNVITTNADVNEGDLIDYSKMIQGTGDFKITNIVAKGAQENPGNTLQQAYMVLPVITINPVESIKITAERLPTKTLRPYYTIRSDIIEENGYLGGTRSGITLPIVSVTNKANPYGDFLNGMGGDIVFTNTINRVLTRIRCSIHEPSGELARCDLNSAILFKINQEINANLSLVDTLLQSKNKEDVVEAEIAEEGPDYSKVDYSDALIF